MRIEGATISLTPLTMGGCVDLATRFVGAHLGPLFRLWLLVTVPTLGLIWGLHELALLDFWTMLAVVYVASSPLGVLLGLAAIPTAFGEAIRGPAFRHRLMSRGPALILRGLWYRLGAAVAGVFCLIPGLWVAVRTGFFVEEACLAQLEEGNDSGRVRELVQRDFSELMSRCLLLMAYCSVLWIALFATVDTFAGMLFSTPILFGRIFTESGFSSMEYAQHLLYRDPRVQMAMAATGLAVYGLGRIAWFFCYIDLRVRRDLWDIELKLSREAARLEGTA